MFVQIQCQQSQTINVKALVLCTEMYIHMSVGKRESTKSNLGLQYLRIRSISVFLKNTDPRTLNAAIKKAHKGMHAKNRHFLMLCTSHRFYLTHKHTDKYIYIYIHTSTTVPTVNCHRKIKRLLCIFNKKILIYDYKC